jgi:putative serine protease PepD
MSGGMAGPSPRYLTALLLGAAVALAGGCGGAGHGSSAVPVAIRVAAVTGSDPLQQQFVTVVKTVSPSVVQIRTPEALGSGVVLDSRGDIVTNAHVVGEVSGVVVTLASGQSSPATVTGRNVGNDLAVVHLGHGRPQPATFADSAQIQVGDIALAIGNPLGLRSSVTQGIVSAVGRSVAEGPSVTLPSVIQTSAAINPGNSGGALVDLAGHVIGIPTLAAIDPELGGVAPGIGFAIDSNTVRRVASALIAAG